LTAVNPDPGELAALESSSSMSRSDPYDAPLSAIRDNAENLGAWLAIWQIRPEPDAHARQWASDAVDAIDAMLRDLHGVRSRLVSEIRES